MTHSDRGDITVQINEVTQQFAALGGKMSLDDYNFEHFRTKHLSADMKATLAKQGIQPGEMAPDFQLRSIEGGLLRLSDLRNKPTLLHFASFTGPITTGSVEPLKKLYAQWGDQFHFVDVVVRQAHPGPKVRAYHSFEQKLQDARSYKREEGILWTVLVDDLEGTVHQVYGGLSDPIYLIDTDGRVAHYTMWTHVPTVHTAIRALMAQGGRGVVKGGIDRVPYLLPWMTDGWRGLRRGLPQSFTDLETAAPGMASSTWLGYQLRPLLAPLTLRATPLPAPVRIALAAAATAMIALAARRISRKF